MTCNSRNLSGSALASCQAADSTFFDQLTTVEKGIAGGVLAAIIIAIIVAAVVFSFGGRKGYQLYQQYHKQRNAQVNDNPMYQQELTRTDNPFYSE